MKVIKYLKEFGIDALESEFSIKVKQYEEGLIVLNYNQIDSPKAHPITMECRGLILDKEFNVVSRSFDRFFNMGEQPDTQAHIDMSKAICYEKIDGSLIRIYHWGGLWRIATRGTAFAESEVNGFSVTFRELVLLALEMSEDVFQATCDANLDKGVSLICEIVSAENRVVKQYSGYHLYYLAARGIDGVYVENVETARQLGMKLPKAYLFDTKESCAETANHLKDLDEGYVLYQGGIPVCKIKSAVYVAIHNIRGEGLSPKRICQIVLTGEQEEYLVYFNEDRAFFTPYIDALANLKVDMASTYESVSLIEGQKEFAAAVKDYVYSSILFQARKLGQPTHTAFANQTDMHKIKLLEGAVS